MTIIKSDLPLQGNSSSEHRNFLCLEDSVTHVFAYPMEMKKNSVKLCKGSQKHVSKLTMDANLNRVLLRSQYKRLVNVTQA